MINRNPKAPGLPGGSLGVAGTEKKSGGKKSWLKGLVTLIVVLIIIGGGIYLIASYTGVGGSLIPGLASSKAEWQAVFLANGQVYFGKVAKINKDFVILKNIYYLQVVNLQDTIGQPADVQTQPEQRLTLIKMGNEIHGPLDEMKINREHVVLIEDLKNDSRVVQAITDYLKKQNQPTPEPTAPAAQ